MSILRMRIFLAAVLVLFWWAAGLAQGTYYKWVDKDGKVHFSNAPPGDAEGAKPVGSEPASESARGAMKSKTQQSLSKEAEQISQEANQARIDLWSRLGTLRELLQHDVNPYSVGARSQMYNRVNDMRKAVKEYESKIDSLLGSLGHVKDVLEKLAIRQVLQKELREQRPKAQRWISSVGDIKEKEIGLAECESYSDTRQKGLCLDYLLKRRR